MKLFTVHRQPEDEGDDDTPPAPLGRLLLDDANMLSVPGNEDDADEDLLDAMEEVNEAEALIIKVRPPPGTAPRSVAKDRVTRDDPRFPQAVADNFRRWHGLILVPEGEGEGAPIS